MSIKLVLIAAMVFPFYLYLLIRVGSMAYFLSKMAYHDWVMASMVNEKGEAT